MSGRDATIAKPSAACCLKGNIHEGQAKGTTTTIAGVETYIAKPAEGAANGNVVLYCEFGKDRARQLTFLR